MCTEDIQCRRNEVWLAGKRSKVLSLQTLEFYKKNCLQQHRILYMWKKGKKKRTISRRFTRTEASAYTVYRTFPRQTKVSYSVCALSCQSVRCNNEVYIDVQWKGIFPTFDRITRPLDLQPSPVLSHYIVATTARGDRDVISDRISHSTCNILPSCADSRCQVGVHFPARPKEPKIRRKYQEIMNQRARAWRSPYYYRTKKTLCSVCVRFYFILKFCTLYHTVFHGFRF